jgi:hypothetical protein
MSVHHFALIYVTPKGLLSEYQPDRLRRSLCIPRKSRTRPGGYWAQLPTRLPGEHTTLGKLAEGEELGSNLLHVNNVIEGNPAYRVGNRPAKSWPNGTRGPRGRISFQEGPNTTPRETWPSAAQGRPSCHENPPFSMNEAGSRNLPDPLASAFRANRQLSGLFHFKPSLRCRLAHYIAKCRRVLKMSVIGIAAGVAAPLVPSAAS